MQYNIIPHKEAQQKLKSHIRFMKNVSYSVAEKIYNEYKNSLVSLSENPHSGLRYEHKSNKNLKYKLFYKQRYRIVFEIIENNVYIYDIQDCRQDTDKKLL